MAVIASYFFFFVLEGRIKRAKSEAEEEVLVKEARRIYFLPERKRREKQREQSTQKNW